MRRKSFSLDLVYPTLMIEMERSMGKCPLPKRKRRTMLENTAKIKYTQINIKTIITNNRMHTLISNSFYGKREKINIILFAITDCIDQVAKT